MKRGRSSEEKDKEASDLKKQCDGGGMCLMQTSAGYGADWKHADFICTHDCSPVQCPNVLICGEASLPQCLLDCHSGLCVNCDIMFGKWQGGKGHFVDC